MRQDARRNREKLIAAASEVMREVGADVALEEIAERAGVGRGTLYRNFADRTELYVAVLDQNLEIIQAQVANHEGDDPDIVDLIKRLVEMMMVFDKYIASLPDLHDPKLELRGPETIERMLRQPMAQAKKDKLLREDITAGDLLVACRMMAASWRTDGAEDRHQALERRMQLMLFGLGGQALVAGRQEAAV